MDARASALRRAVGELDRQCVTEPFPVHIRAAVVRYACSRRPGTSWAALGEALAWPAPPCSGGVRMRRRQPPKIRRWFLSLSDRRSSRQQRWSLCPRAGSVSRASLSMTRSCCWTVFRDRVESSGARMGVPEARGSQKGIQRPLRACRQRAPGRPFVGRCVSVPESPPHHHQSARVGWHRAVHIYEAARAGEVRPSLA